MGRNVRNPNPGDAEGRDRPARCASSRIVERAADVRQAVADNYNHLLEQPTIFYALVFYIVLSGHTDELSVLLAWTYVALRVVHTLIQCTVNIVVARFLVFALSTFILMVMAGRELLLLL